MRSRARVPRSKSRRKKYLILLAYINYLVLILSEKIFDSVARANPDTSPHIQALESHHALHQTKDPLRVQRFLGHTTFQHTQLYIQLEESLFQDTQDDYMCKTAITAEEARALIEVGFEYVNEIQGIHLYRKRK